MKSGSDRPADSRPNVLFILADDLGYGDLGCYGAGPEHVRTPNIDRLAREGMRFTDAHSPSSVCTPSRYNLLTGRYCWRTWAKTGCIWANDPCLIEPDRPTIASVFREAGYETVMVGKWHLGFGSPDDPQWDPFRGPDFNRPLSHGPCTSGFDRFYGVPGVGQEPHVLIRDNMVCDLESGDPIRMVPDPRPRFMVPYDKRPRDLNWDITVEGGRKATYQHEELALDLTRDVVEFLKEDHEKPFFCYFAHRNVHAPLRPHPRFKGTSGNGDYGDFIHELDWSVGEVLKTLDEQGLTENTLVVFASDNGATEHHQSVDFVNNNGLRSNGILRGGKTEVFEGGQRIPFLARLPGTIAPGGTCDHLIALTDMLETCAGLAGVPVPESASPDGIDCAEAFTDPESAPARTTLIHDSFFDVVFAIRHHNWKLIMNQHAGGFSARRELLPKTRTPGLLYDLDVDPSERENLYSQRPEVVNQLIDLYLAAQQAEDADSQTKASV